MIKDTYTAKAEECTFSANGYSLKRNHNNQLVSTPLDLPSNDAMCKLYEDKVKADVKKRQRNILFSTSGPNPYWWGDSYSSDLRPNPEPLETLYEYFVRPKNPNYKGRSKKGEIVTSSMDANTIHVISYPRIVPSHIYFYAAASPYEDYAVNVLGIEPRLETIDGTTRIWYFIDHTHIVTNISVRIPYYWCTTSILPPHPITAEWIYQKVSTSRFVDTGAATAAQAKANKLYLDALTALAEAPEAIKSLLAGLSMVTRLLKDAKRREFSLSKAHEVRKRKLDISLTNADTAYYAKLAEIDRKYNKRLAQLDQQYSSISWNRARKVAELDRRRTEKELLLSKRKAVREYELRRKTLKKAIANSAIETADGIAGVWLNFRYNIMPIVYTAIDVTEALTKKPTFITVREKMKSRIDYFKTYQHSVPCRFTGRCWVKTKVASSSSSTSVMSANLFTTGWELVSKSFVIDWFINVGDFITAYSGGYFSDRKNLVMIKQDTKYDEVTEDGSRLYVNINCYWREQHSNNQYSCLNFEPDMNPMRYTDAIALLWNDHRKLAIQLARKA